MAAWLNDKSLAKKREAAEAVLDMPGVIASYHFNAAQNDYVLFRDEPHDAAPSAAGSLSTPRISWTRWPRRTGRTSSGWPRRT